jgi:ribosomal protein S18 acetylase RimI-like enzyme
VSMIFRTEEIFWRAEGEVIDRGEYRLVRTPSNPTYYGGNLLGFARPPAAGDYPRWMALFGREFGGRPEVRHVFFMWDAPGGVEGEVAPFLEGGFVLQSNVTLLAREVVPPPKLNRELEVRRLETDEEWEALLDAKVRLRDPRFGADSYALYKRRWLGVRRGLAAEGRGAWFGAFVGGQMVGDLGLFRDGTVGRFQDVATEPEFRRRGVCGTLVYEAARRALEAEGVETLVMAADENYHAARIYESVGFRALERHVTACRYPPRP